MFKIFTNYYFLITLLLLTVIASFIALKEARSDKNRNDRLSYYVMFLAGATMVGILFLFLLCTDYCPNCYQICLCTEKHCEFCGEIISKIHLKCPNCKKEYRKVSFATQITFCGDCGTKLEKTQGE